MEVKYLYLCIVSKLFKNFTQHTLLFFLLKFKIAQLKSIRMCNKVAFKKKKGIFKIFEKITLKSHCGPEMKGALMRRWGREIKHDRQIKSHLDYAMRN